MHILNSKDGFIEVRYEVVSKTKLNEVNIMKNEFLKELQWRGLINDCTDLEALDELVEKREILHYTVVSIQRQDSCPHIGHY